MILNVNYQSKLLVLLDPSTTLRMTEEKTKKAEKSSKKQENNQKTE